MRRWNSSDAAAVLTAALAGNYPSSAFLYISEFSSPINNGAAGSNYPLCPTLADQVVAFGSISAASAPFGPATRMIRVQSTAISAVKIGGAAPVAVAGVSARVTAGQVEYFAVSPGDAVAAIVST